ncbi:MAG: sensor histidine kinase [Clostridia bacterium]|nr:sensor histidine kinase [Clostridia bacterium]
MEYAGKVLSKLRETTILRTLFNKFLAMKLRSKFIVSFFLLVIIPFIALGVTTYQSSEKTIRNNVSSLAQKNITKISSNIDYYLSDIQSSTNILVTHQGLRDYYKELTKLSSRDSDKNFKNLAVQNDSYKIITNIISMKQEKLSGIYFADPNGIFLLHPQYSYFISENNQLDERWYKETFNTSGNKLVANPSFILGKSGKPRQVITISQAVKEAASNKSLGVLRVDLNYEGFSNLIQMDFDDSFKNSTLLVLDDHLAQVYCNTPNIDICKLNLLPQMKNSSGTLLYNPDGKEMLISYVTSSYTHWKVISIIPSNEVLKDLIVIKYIIIFATFVCTLLILFFSSIISSVFLKPVNQLAAAMGEIEKGDFSTRVSIKSQDETRYLADSFNKMAANIENLISKVYHAELKQRDAELQSLQSQINPHFLYNTLESIRGVALSNKIESIASMAKSLSQLFRYSISQVHLVELKDELQHLQNYISIQNFRHDDKFELDLDVSEELHKYAILKLSLQPIVENSIKHGLEMQLGKGKIEIKAFLSDNRITLIIKDNGKGIPKEKVDVMNKQLSNNSEPTANKAEPYHSGGLGLHNVNSRLKLHFGKEFGLRFFECDSGAAVEIIYPAVEWEDL